MADEKQAGDKPTEASQPTTQPPETQPPVVAEQNAGAASAGQQPAEEMSPEEKERAATHERLDAKLQDPQYLAERETYEAQVRASLNTTKSSGPGYSRRVTRWDEDKGSKVNRAAKASDYHGSNYRDR